jgi:hypothetical protein
MRAGRPRLLDIHCQRVYIADFDVDFLHTRPFGARAERDHQIEGGPCWPAVKK